MGKKFKGTEKVYTQSGQAARVRFYESDTGILQKVVMIVGGKNIVLSPAELLIAAEVATELRPALVSRGEAVLDPVALLVKKHVLPFINTKVADTPNGYWKISAIKKYRQVTDSGLKDAKDAVEWIEAMGFENWLNKIWVPYRVNVLGGRDLAVEAGMAEKRMGIRI